MNNTGSTVVHFDYGRYYSDDGDDVRWNRKETHIYTLIFKRSLDEVTYDAMVDKICMKIRIDKDMKKLMLSYIPLLVCPKRPSYIFDDDDVFGYLMDVDKDQCRSVLHVELSENDEENHTFAQLSRVDCRSGDDITNEELASDARANDMIYTLNSECEPSEHHELDAYGGLDIVPGVTITDGINEMVQYDDVDVDATTVYVDTTAVDVDTTAVDVDTTAVDVDTTAVDVDTPVVDVDTTTIVAGNIGNVEWEDGIGLTIGQEFESKQDVQDLVELAIHENCFEVKTAASTTKLLVFKCRVQGCKWMLRVAKLKNSEFFSVRTYHNMHICIRATTSTMKNKRKGTARLVASVLCEDYPGAFKTPCPKDLIGMVQGRKSVKVSYATAWRGRKLAASDVRGTPEESYTMLPSYLHMLEKVNPGTVTRLKVDDDRKFRYVFFALGACIEGFRSMRQVLIMDGTHLKNCYGGLLIIASAQDPECHTYPIAFGVVDGENDGSYGWFLNTLKTVIPDSPELVFVTDRHKSIIKKVEEVYPMATHGYCIYHMSQNVKGKVHNNKKEVAERFREIAQLYNPCEFLRLYTDLVNRYPRVGVYLDDSVEKSKWARCLFPGVRYNIDTTNLVESLNNVLKDARHYSLLPMLDVIVGKIAEWFNKWRKKCGEIPNTQKLVPKVNSEMHDRCKFAKKCTVQELNTYLLEYNVLGRDGKHYLVDLRKKTCSCKHFDIDKYPCEHAIAANSTYAASTGDEVHLHELCSKYYLVDQWCGAYCRTVYLVPHKSDWVIPEEIEAQCVLPPRYVPKKGRPQVTRIPSAGESRRRRSSMWSTFTA